MALNNTLLNSISQFMNSGFFKKKNKKQSLDLKTHFSKMTKVLRMCGAWACEDGGNR